MSSYVVDVLRDFLGEPKKHNEDRGQIAFDCPACASDKDIYTQGGDGKGNLEINYMKGVFKCWACQETNGMRGAISKLIVKYGNKDILKRFNLVKPDYNYSKNEDTSEIKLTEELPKGFLQLNEKNSGERGYKAAMGYLSERGITQEIINKFNIGFINYGELNNRVIIPSYNENGLVNYYIARSYNKWAKPKYLNSETPKEHVIFNRSLINPYATIYLVEGPFDSLVVPNCIPLLGLYLHDNLYWYLQNNAKADVVIILDGEAKKDAESVYKKLNNLHLYNRVKIIYLKEEFDTSLIYEKYGNRGIKTILNTATQLNEYNY
jgi:DNA primase